jgi:predicted MPP superfamily phosphohydrolase
LKRIFLGWLIFSLLCWSVIGLLVAPYLPGGWLAVGLLAVLVGLPLSVLVRGFSGGAYPSAATRLFVMRPFWYSQLMVPLFAASGLLGIVGGLPFGAALSAGRWAMAIVGAIAALFFIVGYAGARSLRVRRFEARFPNLPEGLDGLRIAQLSDTHIGPHIPKGWLRRVVASVEKAAPDLIVFTGDQVDDYARDVEPFRAAFGSLAAPLGVYAIIGNHDVYAGWSAVRRGLENMGMKVLVNRPVALEHNGARLWLAGTGDPAAKGWNREDAAEAVPDVERTLAGVPDEEFTVALAHNPALWPALASRGVDLTLSGHTHYGQFSIPRIGWSLASPFLEHAMGSYTRDRSLLYINPGTGYWGLPFRIGSLPEVTIITLKQSPAPPTFVELPL